ncbi:hypothetical protein B6U80_01535 [Candidatus Pacearchaeota archaeon ex4484_26]|nr:MAG: hypothetical protein B6U80_01535 [Candidatus Pacearchaeota archaeon ex4484_26]
MPDNNSQNKGLVKRLAIISTAFALSALTLYKAPTIYDFGKKVKTAITQTIDYYQKPNIAQLTLIPKGIEKVHTITPQEKGKVRIVEGGKFDVDVKPKAIYKKGNQFFLQVKVYNHSENYLTAGFRTRGLLGEHFGKVDYEMLGFACGAEMLEKLDLLKTPKEYRIPKGKEFDIYILGNKLPKGSLKSDEEKVGLYLNVTLDTPKQGGFREVMLLELPASPLEKLLTN